jgi:hypothetical protein
VGGRIWPGADQRSLDCIVAERLQRCNGLKAIPVCDEKSEEILWLYLEALCDVKEIEDREVSGAALDLTEVSAIDTRCVCQIVLRHPPFSPQRANVCSDGFQIGIERRLARLAGHARIVCGCGLSANSRLATNISRQRSPILWRYLSLDDSR